MSKLSEVVSFGVNHTFKVIFTPLEHVTTMAKRPHFFGSRFLLFILRHQYLFLYFFLQEEGPQHINSAFLTAQGRKCTAIIQHLILNITFHYNFLIHKSFTYEIIINTYIHTYIHCFVRHGMIYEFNNILSALLCPIFIGNLCSLWKDNERPPQIQSNYFFFWNWINLKFLP